VSFTEEFIKMAHANGGGDQRSEVKEVYDLIQSGMVKEASQRMPLMSDDDMRELNALLGNGGMEKNAGMGTTGGSSAMPLATGKNREERGEGKPSTETGKTDESTLKQPENSGAKKEQGSPLSSDIGAMLNTPINETLRTPEGDSSQEDLKKTAEAKLFIENFKKGILEGVDKLAGLVKQKGRLNLAEEYGEPFTKIASVYGPEVAKEVILRAQADGVREAIMAGINNQEVKMGSLNELYAEQSKVASVNDLGEFARELGRLTVMNKVANLQAMEEGMDEGEVTAEDVQELEALVDQATEAPETLTDEEAEIILQLADEQEDAEADLMGAEKVTTVMDIVASLRHNGW